MSVKVDMKALFEAGAHFGHKTSRWHPKMAPYIHSKRQESHIIDLEKTVELLEKSLPVLTEIAKKKPVLFVGTKKQVREVVREKAEEISQPYVTERWIGGMLTNSQTIVQQIKKLKNLDRRMKNGDLEKRYNKLEVQRLQEEIDSLNHKYGGIKDLIGRPGALIVTDVIADANAVSEANTLGIPVFGIVDTNANPEKIDYPIPANDDAIKATSLLLDYFAKAVQEGAAERKKAADEKKAQKEGK